jgi:putative zinc finger/helix-turn-helix YgiT family protein
MNTYPDFRPISGEVFATEEQTCPACDHHEVDTEETATTFPYGDGDDAVELEVTLPVHTCRQCGFQFTDEEAERRRHDAICKHRRLMTPKRIRAIRGEFTQRQFSQLTGLGEATIGRWERGELIQSDANDRLLFLLTYSDNIDRLRNRDTEVDPAVGAHAFAQRLRFPSFRALRNPAKELLKEAEDFVL